MDVSLRLRNYQLRTGDNWDRTGQMDGESEDGSGSADYLWDLDKTPVYNHSVPVRSSDHWRTVLYGGKSGWGETCKDSVPYYASAFIAYDCAGIDYQHYQYFEGV